MGKAVVRKVITTEEFSELFGEVKKSSWRWECQGDYSIDHDEVQKWLAGTTDPDESAEWAEWLRYIESLTASGIPFARVRVVTEPITDYLVWMLATTDHNIDAGEDIRWCKESFAKDLGMPDYDFYIFDDDRVVVFHHDEDKNFIHAELVDDEDFVTEHRALRDKIRPYGVKHRDFLFETIKRGVDLLS